MFKKFKFLSAVLFLAILISILNFNQDQIKAATESNEKDYAQVFPDNKVQRIDISINASDFRTMENDLSTKNMMTTVDPIYAPATVKFNNRTWNKVGIRYKGASTLYTPKQSNKHKYPFRLNFSKYGDQNPELKDQNFYGFKELKFSNNWYDPSLIRDKVTSDILRNGGIKTARGAFYRVYIDVGNGPEYWGLYTVFEDIGKEFLDSQFSNSDGNLYKGQQGTGADLTTFNKQGYEKKTNSKEDNWSDLQSLVTNLNANKSNAATWRSNLESVFDVNNFLKWLAINTAIINFDTYGWVTKNHYFYQDLNNKGRLVYVPWDFNLSLTSDPFGMMGMNFGGAGNTGGFGGFGGFGNFGATGTNRATNNTGNFGNFGNFGNATGNTGNFANAGNMGAMGAMGAMGTIPATLSLNEIGKNWPLIRNLMDDPVYKNTYHKEMQTAMKNCFNESKVIAEMQRLHQLIKPYVVGTEGEISKNSFLTSGESQFNQGLTDLVNHVRKRQTDVSSYLSTVTISPN